MVRITCGLLLLVSTILRGGTCNLTEYHLLQNLFDEYNFNALPASNPQSNIVVTIDIAINQIIDVDDTAETLKSKLWIRLSWIDHNLRWDPILYSNITTLFVVPNLIWTPDITLYQEIISNSERGENIGKYRAKISSSGHVIWNRPHLYHTTCGLNVRYFPFDEQRCKLKFGPWAYSRNYVDMVSAKPTGDVSTYICNGEWDLLGMPAKRSIVKYFNGQEFVDITYTLVLHRKPLYYIFNLFLPCIFMMFTASLVFCLPPSSGEKVNLGITIFLALTVFLLLVAQLVPTQSEFVPLTGIYFATSMCILAFATAATVLTLNIHHRGELGIAPPKLLKTIFHDYLSRPLFVAKHVIHQRKARERQLQRQRLFCRGLRAQANLVKSIVQQRPENGLSRDPEHKPDPQLKTIIGVLQEAREAQDEEDAARLIAKEWSLIAMVIDRLLFVIVTIMAFCSTAIIIFDHMKLPDGEPVTCKP